MSGDQCENGRNREIHKMTSSMNFCVFCHRTSCNDVCSPCFLRISMVAPSRGGSKHPHPAVRDRRLRAIMSTQLSL
jgi:hypothetical protein